MKYCPQCRNTYSDDNSFCLDDGTALEFCQSLSGDMPTMVIPGGSSSPASQPVQAPGRNNWLFPVVGILAGLVVILGFLLVYKLNSNKTLPEYETVKKEIKSQTPGQATPETPAPAVTPVKTPAIVPAYLPAQSRVKFGKGKVSANVTGLVPPGANRSLVMACRAGQYLSASITSPGSCVSFADGSTSTEAFTASGDNFVYLKNNCGRDGSFNMTVFIK